MNEKLSESSSPKPITLLIAEDHELAREGLRYTLERKNEIEIIGEAENGDEAVRLTRDLHPDVVLMDIGMPVMDGITATETIKATMGDVKVVILTSHQDGEEVYASLAAGADAYCMKDIKTERLIQVLEMVQEGAVWLDPAVARLVMGALPLKMGDKKKTVANVPRQGYTTELTDRELDVLRLIVDGLSNKEIARDLNVTIHTVKAHVCNIIQKLSVDDRTQAAVKALREGIISHK